MSLGMPYVTMGGPSLTLPSFVIAVKPSLSIMQWFATWGFPTIHHNEIRNLTVSLLTEVCPNVAVEPHVQPLSEETLRLASANTNDGPRLDVLARGFWNTCQDAYFDVRVFTPMIPATTQEVCLPRTRSMKMKGNEYVPSMYSNQTQHLHPTYTFNLRWYGKRSTNILQTLCRLVVSL